MEEAERKEQGESWSLGNEGEQGFEKGEASFSPRCRTIHPADSRGLFGKKTQRSIKAGRLPEFIKANQGTGFLSTRKKNCLGVIWKLMAALVNLGRTPPYIFSWMYQWLPLRTFRDNREGVALFCMSGVGLPVGTLLCHLYLVILGPRVIYVINKSKPTLLSSCSFLSPPLLPEYS